MMPTFICETSDCPNNGVTYVWGDDEVTTAECGGCGAVLEARNV